MFLINIGADVSTQAKNGCTAFDMASLIGRIKRSTLIYEPVHEKTNNLGLRPGPTQTKLYGDSIKLEA